ncbi:MAG: serine hydrolase [Bacteroidetes bacterium]|nr:serine hydrolase [Bacteroidota bacterium]
MREIGKILLGITVAAVIGYLLNIAFNNPAAGNSQEFVEPVYDFNSFNDDIVYPPFIDSSSLWVDSVFNSLSLDQKIGQLFMVAAYSNKGDEHIEQLAGLIQQYHIGSLIFFQGGPSRQARYTNYLQSQSPIPLLIAMDAEWGISMRLDSVVSFPHQMAMGAIRDNRHIYDFGKAVASQCKRVGVHINLAPVVDVNNNVKNPVINNRSFGEDRANVALKGVAYMKGMQDEHVLACAKHFPGHGDTDADSHLTLPSITHSRERLDSIELFPFKSLINAGVGSIMSAHLNIPALDSTPNLASSLSAPIIDKLLRNELSFEGLIITDALNMQGVTKYFRAGDIEVRALKAGNDILLMPQSVSKALTAIKKAIEKNEISIEEIDLKVRKILQLKYWAGLSNYQPIELEGITADLNHNRYDAINSALAESSLCLLKNKDDLIPFIPINGVSYASISIGSRHMTEFQKTMSKYNNVAHFSVNKNASSDKFNEIFAKVRNHDVVIVGIHHMNRHERKDYGISLQTLGLLKKLQRETKVAVVVFGSSYSLKYFEDVEWLVNAHEGSEWSQKMAAQLLFGSISVNGTIPVSASDIFSAGSGLVSQSIGRLKYSVPEDVGINSADLLKIDSIVLEAIDEENMPGCQVLVAVNGKVIWESAYGHHTYDKKNKVKITDLYDLASITKIASTLIGIMKLYDEGIVDLDKSLGFYLPELEETNKENIILRDILIHQSGLKDWIPFYVRALRVGRDDLFSASRTDSFSIPVANNMYMHRRYVDVMWKNIIDSKVKSNHKYVYSDVGYYFLKKIIEDTVKQPIHNYMQDNVYGPMGLHRIGFNPLDRFSLNEIVPTENDETFREQLVHGYVHDPGAAMLGGVGGHAGLFSNASDLAVLAQMMLDDGEYAGVRYIEQGTVPYFSSKQVFDNRRGLGFDKTQTDRDKVNPTCDQASPKTFGHTGFTGTCVWIDPEYNLVFIFLSNRVNPDATNVKLVSRGVRTRIQSVVYRALQNADRKGNLERPPEP